MTYLFEDVTERLDLERRFDALIRVQGETLDNLGEAVAVFGSDGRLRLSNPAFARLWDLASELLAERPHIETVLQLCAPLGAEAEWERLRRAVLRHLPIAWVHHLAVYPTALLWLLLRIRVRPSPYLRLLAGFGFGHLRSIVFDQMLPRIAHYWRREAVLGLMTAAGLTDVRIAPVNSMSWSAIGARPVGSSAAD